MIRNGTFWPKSLEISYLRAKIWDSRHVQLAIYTVLDEESESDVNKCQILQPGGKTQEKRNRESRCLRSESLEMSYFGIKIRDSGHVQLAIYTVSDQESYFSRQKSQIPASKR